MSREALVLYQRRECHLCEEMVAGLRSLQAAWGFSLKLVDVDASEQLRERYDERVPVLAEPGGREICHHFLDAAALRRYLGIP